MAFNLVEIMFALRPCPHRQFWPLQVITTTSDYALGLSEVSPH